MSKKFSLTVLMLLLLPVLAVAQEYNEMTPDGNINRVGANGNRNFNPHNNDTTSNAEIPKGIYVWTVDRLFGDMQRVEVDTLPHLYPQSTLGMGRTGDFQTVGTNYAARLSRIFTDRRPLSQSLFTDVYDQVLVQPEEWHFTNTLSPITNLSYDNCGDKTNGEDHLDARFAVNAGRQTGFGFDLNYLYSRGYYQNQNNSHFSATFYASHLGDRYQMHAFFQTNHQKATENGGIVSDDYITHPEHIEDSYSDNEIPTFLSSNWNRFDNQRFFLTHRYSMGFYRKVPMTEEEKMARQFALDAEKEKNSREGKDKEAPAPEGRPDDAVVVDAEAPAAVTDSAAVDQAVAERIRVDSKAMADSLKALAAAADTADLFMKREFVPVTSFIHTLDLSHHERIYQAYESPQDFYADTLYDARPLGGFVGDSIYDKTRYLGLRNTVALALLEGFNKYAAAGLKVFASHELRRFDLPDIDEDGTSFYRRWTENSVSLGGQLQRSQGRLLHWDFVAEAWLAGEDAGQLKLDGRADLNFRLLGDTVRLDAKAYVHRLHPTFLQRHYHSKHFWWDNDLEKMTRTHLEGELLFGKTNTRLRVAVDNIQKYTYLGMSYTRQDESLTGLTAAFRQHDEAVNVLTAQLDQRLALGPLHWDNILTYQTTSDDDVLPLPQLNLFTNLYLQFTVAHVLRVEMGASGTWFSKYQPVDFLPQLNQFAVQENKESRMELGNFPYVDVYANLHLKHARFFVLMNNALAKNFDRKSFLTPHYPLNRSVLHLGVSWNFFN